MGVPTPTPSPIPTLTLPPLSDNDTSSSFLDGMKTFNNTFQTGDFINQIGDGNSVDKTSNTQSYILMFLAVLFGAMVARISKK